METAVVTWGGKPVDALSAPEMQAALGQIAEWSGVLELTDLRAPQLSGEDSQASEAFWKRVRGA